ncbi:Thioredoxin H1 [Linum perenne]
MAEEGQVISCTTVEIWKEKFESASQSKKLVNFSSFFSAPVLADLAKKMPNVLFLKVDVDELRVNHKSKSLYLTCNLRL